MKYFIFISLFIFGAYAAVNFNTPLFEWNELSFSWPNETFKKESIIRGDFIVENNVPLGVEVWRNKVFLTIPRWFNGIAATLAYFDLNSTEKSPILIPYPSWENHNIDDYSPNTIVNTPRTSIDSCNRLWTMDVGVTNTFKNPVKIGAAKIIVIDLETDQIIRNYQLKSTDQSDDTFFAQIVIDIKGDNCDEAYAYITDHGNNAFIIYSFGQNDSWTFKHNFFNIEPLLGNYWLQGLNYQLNDALFGAALGPRQADGYRTLYFHAHVSHNEFSVNTKVLQNSTLVSHNNYYFWKHEGYKGDHTCSQSSVFDEQTNILITAPVELDGIACWNPKVNLVPDTYHLVAQNHETLAFPSDVKIDTNRNLWVLTARLPIFLFSTPNLTETNIRILTAPIDDLIAGTGCAI